MRRPYQESCRTLVEKGLLEEPIPSLPPRMPAYDDEGDAGVSFFRTHLEGADLSGLTLPRTFSGRSLVSRCSWVDTDLTESQLGQLGLDDAQQASVSVEIDDADDVPGGG